MSVLCVVLTVNNDLDMINLIYAGIACNEMLGEKREYDIYAKSGADKRGKNGFR